MKIYIDESGDIGLGPKSSAFFVIAALIVRKPVEIQRCFKKLRRNHLKKKYRELPEFKFNNSGDEIRRRVLKCLASSDIEFWCSVLRKEDLYDHLRDQPQIVYNYLTGSLIAKMSFHYHPFDRFDVIVDKSLNGIQRDFFDQYIVYKTMEQNVPIIGDLSPPHIIHVDSRKNPCIQAVDFIAGAIHRKYRGEGDTFSRVIEPKCKQVFDYFEGPHNRA